MTHPLFIEIDRFDKWARSQYDMRQDEIGGEWETNYAEWNKITSAFKDYLANTDPHQWSELEKDRILYIIARDNELGMLVDSLPEQALIILTEHSIDNGQRDDKWQLAVNLHRIKDKQVAANLLESLLQDEDEYVSRMALAELPKINPGKVEHYAELFWNRNKYKEMDEYQKMMALHVLKKVNSALLDTYLDLAKKDSRQYLTRFAIKIESDLAGK